MDETLFSFEADPVRQGDLLIGHDAALLSNRRRFVILTADCDLAQNKTGGLVTVAPIISVDDFIIHDWREHQAAELKELLRGFICDQFNKYARACNPDHIDVDANFIISWANEEGSDAIADTVSLDGDARMHFTTAVERYAELSTNQWKCLPTEKWIDLFYNTKYETGLSTIKPKPKARRNEIKNTLKGFGLDIFQFNSFPGENQLGWIARLRLFEGLDLGLVKRNKRDWFSQPTNLFRIGRLAPPFKTSIAQQFSSLFSRVGLPDDFYRMKDLIIDDACMRHYNKED